MQQARGSSAAVAPTLPAAAPAAASAAAPVFRVHDTSADAIAALGVFVADAADAAIASRGAFLVATSGGSVATALPSGLSALAAAGRDLQTERWVLFYTDERSVPHTHADSNHGATVKALAGAAWWRGRVVPVDTSLPPAEAARAYEATLRAELSAARASALDVAVLGVGPDGHTASLFPGHALLGESVALVASLGDSPKPPSSRVTLTLPALNAAAAVAFYGAGADKAPALARIAAPLGADGAAPLPARRVAAAGASAVFFVDKAAAVSLPSTSAAAMGK